MNCLKLFNTAKKIPEERHKDREHRGPGATKDVEAAVFGSDGCGARYTDVQLWNR